MKRAFLLFLFIGCQQRSSEIYVDLLSPDIYIELKPDATFHYVSPGHERHGQYLKEKDVIVLKFVGGEAESLSMPNDSMLASEKTIWRKCKPVGSAVEYRQFFKDKIYPKYYSKKMFDSVKDEVSSIAASVYQHRIRPSSMGGGGGTFFGYTIPEYYATTPFAKYTALVRRDSVVISAMVDNILGAYICTIGEDGRPRNERYGEQFSTVNDYNWW